MFDTKNKLYNQPVTTVTGGHRHENKDLSSILMTFLVQQTINTYTEDQKELLFPSIMKYLRQFLTIFCRFQTFTFTATPTY